MSTSQAPADMNAPSVKAADQPALLETTPGETDGQQAPTDTNAPSVEAADQPVLLKKAPGETDDQFLHRKTHVADIRNLLFFPYLRYSDFLSATAVKFSKPMSTNKRHEEDQKNLALMANVRAHLVAPARNFITFLGAARAMREAHPEASVAVFLHKLDILRNVVLTLDHGEEGKLKPLHYWLKDGGINQTNYGAETWEALDKDNIDLKESDMDFESV